MKNAFEIDYTDNPDVAAMLAGKDIGAKLELRLTAQLNRKDDQRAELTVEEIEVAETKSEDDEAEEESVEASAEEPVSVMLNMRRNKKEQPDAGA